VVGGENVKFIVHGRTKKHPDGIPGLKKKDRDLIKTSTLISDNVWDMVEKLSVKGTYISVENPLTSLQLGHDVGQIAKMLLSPSFQLQ